MRGLAVLLLVSFHVVGSGQGGLGLAAEHPLSIVNDHLALIRMPMFAFVAGFVYALRPPVLASFRGFVQGKLRRLYLPATIAILAFAVASQISHTRFAVPLSDYPVLLVLPYAHYWFFQALFLILVGYGLLDAATGQRVHLVVLAVAILVCPVIPFISPAILSINGAVYLLPFFLVGVCAFRCSGWLSERRTMVGILSLAVLAIAFLSVFFGYDEVLIHGSRTNTLAGIAACLLLLGVLRQPSPLILIGPYSFMIYLYHVFFTAGARMALVSSGVSSVPTLYLLGLFAGLAGPVMLQHLAQQNHRTRQIVVGLSR